MFKKLTMAWTISLLMAEASIEDILLALDWGLCVHYLFWFKNNEVWALINSGSKINAITPTYIAKLSLKIRYINIRAQKIDGSIFKTFEIVLTNFKIKYK